MRLLLLLSFLFFKTIGSYAEDEMPIIAFLGVPEWRTTDEDYRIFSECGFNVNINNYSSTEQLLKACRFAEKYGVKIIGRCPEMSIQPDVVAKTLRQERGFMAYMMKDEPSLTEIDQLQKDMQRLHQTDEKHLFYINLFPHYHKDWIEPSNKARSYPEYIEALTKTICQQISFDFYPITTKGIRNTWYENLEMVRTVSRKTGKPFWGFVLSVPHDVPFTPDTYYPTPTLGALRLQAYSNLVYGAQGIQYFTYWTPGDTEGFHYHDGPVDENGKKTNTYALVQVLNNELKSLSSLFYGSTILDLGHLGVIPEGTKRIKKMPVNIKKLKVSGYQGAIVSVFEKNQKKYLAIVNKSHEKEMTLTIKARNNKPRLLDKQLNEHPIKVDYQVAPGDMLIFSL